MEKLTNLFSKHASTDSMINYVHLGGVGGEESESIDCMHMYSVFISTLKLASHDLKCFHFP